MKAQELKLEVRQGKSIISKQVVSGDLVRIVLGQQREQKTAQEVKEEVKLIT